MDLASVRRLEGKTRRRNSHFRASRGEAATVHRHIPYREIAERIRHIRDLHRQLTPSDETERLLSARREQKTKDLLSNLKRIRTHPTLNLVREFGNLDSMTVDAVHRLFGFDLDAIRDYDLRLNGDRTHIECLH